jgi:hypothetical protein
VNLSRVTRRGLKSKLRCPQDGRVVTALRTTLGKEKVGVIQHVKELSAKPQVVSIRQCRPRCCRNPRYAIPSVRWFSRPLLHQLPRVFSIHCEPLRTRSFTTSLSIVKLNLLSSEISLLPAYRLGQAQQPVRVPVLSGKAQGGVTSCRALGSSPEVSAVGWRPKCPRQRQISLGFPAILCGPFHSRVPPREGYMFHHSSKFGAFRLIVSYIVYFHQSRGINWWTDVCTHSICVLGGPRRNTSPRPSTSK